MINIFRNYSPLNIIWLVVLLIILRLGYLVQVPDKLNFVFVESYARSLIPVAYENLFSPSANILLASLVVLIQAILLNYLVNYYNLLSKPTFLPAIMYVVVTGLFTPFLTLSPPLFCNFLVIWMLFKLFDLYKANDAKTTAYDTGMLVAAGSLIYLPFTYMILVIWIALLIFRPFDWRDWAASIIGYATIYFFLGVYYYLNDRLGEFLKIWLPLGTPFPEAVHINYYNFLVLIPVILILVLCFFRLQSNFFKSYVQTRKAFQLLLFLFLIAGLAFYVKADFRLNHFLLCTIPVAAFFSYYFVYATKRWFYETLFFLLLVSIIYFQFNTF